MTDSTTQGREWYNSKEIYEFLQAHATENVDSFSAIRRENVDAFSAIQVHLSELTKTLELMGVRLEPITELRKQICQIEAKADIANKRLDKIDAEGDGRGGVSRAVLWVLTVASISFAMYERIIH